MTFDDAKVCFAKDLSVIYKGDLSQSAWRIVEVNELSQMIKIQRLTDDDEEELIPCNSEDIERKGQYSYKYFLYRYPKREIYSNDHREESDKFMVL